MPRIVRVAVPVPLFRLFDYTLEPGVAWPLPGCRVRVPFAQRMVTGVVLECAEDSEFPVEQLKPVATVLDATPLLTEELMRTLIWAARYYQHAIGEVFDAALPTLLRSGGELPVPGDDGIELTAAGRAALEDPQQRRGTRIAELMALLGGGSLSNAELDERMPGWRPAWRSLRDARLARGVPIAEPGGKHRHRTAAIECRPAGCRGHRRGEHRAVCAIPA